VKKITVIVRDNYNAAVNYPDPLLYTVDVRDPTDKNEVAHAVNVERAADIGCSISELDLDVLCAFAGDISPVADWRE
jgi:hypothetical protein